MNRESAGERYTTGEKEVDRRNDNCKGLREDAINGGILNDEWIDNGERIHTRNMHRRCFYFGPVEFLPPSMWQDEDHFVGWKGIGKDHSA